MFYMQSDAQSWPYSNGPCTEILPPPRRPTAIQKALKRTCDIAGALAFFVLFGPLYLCIAAAVFVGTGGPVYYWQTRLGRDGRPFRCYKFRSMEKGADELLKEHLARDPAAQSQWDKFQKLDNDPRITRVGRVIRRLSLDELPQFYSVLIGDMSLVGPRPCMTRQRSLYGSAWSHYCHMRPGITGLWQVSGRNRLPFASRVALDVRYAADWSLGMDARILARTLWIVIKGEGSS